MSETTNKASIVRDLLEKNPSLKPMDIVKIMGEKNIEISNRYVSIIKNKIKKSANGAERKISVAKRRMNLKNSGSLDSNIGDMLAIKSLYDSMGAERLKIAVDALEKIVG